MRIAHCENCLFCNCNRECDRELFSGGVTKPRSDELRVQCRREGWKRYKVSAVLGSQVAPTVQVGAR